MTSPDIGADERLSDSPDTFRRMVEAVCDALQDAPNGGQQARDRRATLEEFEARLERAARLLERGRHGVVAVAVDFLRATLPDGACAVPWPVCSHCLEAGLGCFAGSSWCRSCGRPGEPGAARSAFLCPQPWTVTVRDISGEDARMCLSQGAGALRDIAGLTVADATDDEPQALFINSHQPVRVDVSRRARPSWPIAIER